MSSTMKDVSSRTKIDILIPAIEKDLVTLPYVIDAVRKHVKHPIGHIYIVAPKRSKMVELCSRKGCTFVDENSVLPITKQNIHYQSNKWELSGWLFQQLLKLSGDRICKAKYFLAIDADTLLIRPHIFTKGTRSVFYCRNWSQPEYFRTYRRLLERNPTSRVSFVTHYMLFNRSKLAQLKQTIRSKHHTSWYSAIIRSMDKTRKYAFSEFETYGNYVYSTNRNGVIIRSALNKSVHQSVRQLSKKRLLVLAKKYRSISFHKRKGYVRAVGVKSR
jgi:hypothetical protein